MAHRSINQFEAVENPAEFFKSPEEVLGDFRLDRKMKIAVLRGWEAVLDGNGSNAKTHRSTPPSELLERIRKARQLLERGRH